jgi:hypothetical protein
MLAEGMRMKVAIVFIIALFLAIPTLPFVLEGDGTLKGRVQNFLTYSLNAVSVLLALLTLFLSCSSVAGEIRDRQIQNVASKPLPRWQFVVGKWLGVVMLNFIMLSISFIGIYGFTLYFQTRPAATPEQRADKLALQHEVLTARFWAKPVVPDLNEIVEYRYQQLLDAGQIPEVMPNPQMQNQIVPATKVRVKQRITMDLLSEWKTVRPGATRTFLFDQIRLEPREDDYIHVRYNFSCSPLPPSMVCDLGITAGLPEKNTAVASKPRKDAIERYHVVEFPASVVADDNTVAISVHNFDIRTGGSLFPRTLSFLGEKGGIEVLYKVGTFEGNMLRTFGILFCKLMFLAAFGVFASCWLSFPVACFVSIFMLVVGSSMGFIRESLDYIYTGEEAYDATDAIQNLFKPLGQLTLLIMPDFSEFNPIAFLADGRNVTLMWVLVAIRDLILVKTLIIGFVAAVILQFRELAKPTT